MTNALIINDIISKTGQNIHQIEKLLGMSNGTLRKAISRGGQLKPSTVEKLVKLFPDIDIALPGHNKREAFNPEVDISDEDLDRFHQQAIEGASLGRRFLMFVEEMNYTKEDVLRSTSIKLDETFFKRGDFTRDLTETEIQSIVTIYDELNPIWLLTGKGEMLNQSIEKVGFSEVRKLGERYLILSPLIEAHGQMAYIAKNQDSVYISGRPQHGIVLDKIQLGTYRSFKVTHENNINKDGFEIPVEEMIFAGDILTARKIDHKAPNFSIDVWKHKDLVIVTKKGISTDRISARYFMDSLRTVPMVLKNDDGKEFAPYNPDDVLEVFVVVAITRKTE